MLLTRYKIITPPQVEPVGLTQMKAHLRVDVDDDDVLIDAQIKAAREFVETETNHAIADQTVAAYSDEFADEMRLPLGGAKSVTSITYLDSDGAEQTLSTDVYGLDDVTKPERVYLKHAQTWPAVRDQRNAVTITYVAGYPGSPPQIPERMVAAIKLVCGDLYENREETVISTANASVAKSKVLDRLLYPLRELGL